MNTKNRIRTLLTFAMVAMAVIGLTAGSASAGLTDGLVEYWEFENNYNAEVTADHVGTLTTTGTGSGTFVPGKFGKCIKLDNSSNNQAYIVIGGDENDFDFAGASMSVSLWYTTESLYASWQTLVAKGEGNGWRLARDGGSATNLNWAANGTIGANGALDQQNGSWHHVVATVDASGGNVLYVDGVQVGTNTGAKTLDNRANAMQIGGNPDAANRGWDGNLDDVAIWNRALTEAEVASIWNGGAGTRILDPNTPDVSAGDDWITWLGEPVTLNAAVTATETSTWDLNDLAYSWIVDPENLVTITGGDTLTPTVTIDSTWFDVTVPNAGFEDKVLNDGSFVWFYTSHSTWRFADPDGTAYTTADNKGYFGQLFPWNPSPAELGGGWDAPGFSGETAEGVNCVAVGSKLRSEEAELSEDAATNYPGGLAQLLDATYDPAQSYILTVKYGKSDGWFSDVWGGCKVELLAGGSNEDSSNQYTHKVVGGTVIGQDINTEAPVADTWNASTVTVLPNPANAALAGEPLQIRLTSMKLAPDDPNTTYVFFDDVKLVTDAAPAMIPVNMTLTVEEISTGKTANAYAMIDVYDTACNATVARYPEAGFERGDLNEDCMINLEDFAQLVAEWLLDYNSTGQVDRPES